MYLGLTELGWEGGVFALKSRSSCGRVPQCPVFLCISLLKEMPFINHDKSLPLTSYLGIEDQVHLALLVGRRSHFQDLVGVKNEDWIMFITCSVGNCFGLVFYTVGCLFFSVDIGWTNLLMTQPVVFFLS